MSSLSPQHPRCCRCPPRSQNYVPQLFSYWIIQISIRIHLFRHWGLNSTTNHDLLKKVNVAFRRERPFFTLSGTSVFSTSDEFSFSSALFSPSFKIIVYSNYLSRNLINEIDEGTCSTEFLWSWFSLGVSSELLVVFSWRKRSCLARLCKGVRKMKPTKAWSRDIVGSALIVSLLTKDFVDGY